VYFAFDETAKITRSKLMTDGGMVEAKGRCFAPRCLYARHNASNKETHANAYHDQFTERPRHSRHWRW
jgi:hypothetical protein